MSTSSTTPITYRMLGDSPLIKALTVSDRAPYMGAPWPLPLASPTAPNGWSPGLWTHPARPVIPCQRGWHLTTARDAIYWAQARMYWAEGSDGGTAAGFALGLDGQAPKAVFAQARLLGPVAGWTFAALADLGIYICDRVSQALAHGGQLPGYARYHSDWRTEKLVEAVRGLVEHPDYTVDFNTLGRDRTLVLALREVVRRKSFGLPMDEQGYKLWSEAVSWAMGAEIILEGWSQRHMPHVQWMAEATTALILGQPQPAAIVWEDSLR